jgi:UDP-glucose 4-epimerase
LKKDQKILIAGANGYLGTHLSHRLKELGYEVILTDRAQKSVLGYENYIQKDLEDSTGLQEFLNGVDVIFFFTGKTGPAEQSFNEPKEFIQGNEVTLVNVLTAIKGFENKPKIVFPSTRLLYKGIDGSGLTEAAAKEAKTVYAVNKLACENYLDLYQRCFGIDYIVFRISLPYGSFVRQHKVSHGIMSFLINSARNGESLKIYGNGNQAGSFIHISDLVNVLIQATFNDSLKNEIYNVGGEDNLTLNSVISSIAKKFDVGVEHVDWPKVSQFAEHGDLVFDSSKINSKIEYQPMYTFGKWLEEIQL